MPQLLKLTVGLPGSGKTTWAKAWVAESPSTRVRVSRNEIRKMLGPSTLITEQREAMISVIESTAVRAALKKKYDVVIDAHHLNPKVVNKWKNYVEKVNTELNGDLQLDFVQMHTPIETCIARDAKREGDDSVGRSVITKLYEKYLKAEPELFDTPPDDGHTYVAVGDAPNLKWMRNGWEEPKEDDMEW